MRWRIYYGHREPFSDRDGLPWEAPATDVQAVAKENVKGNPPVKVKAGPDAFYWDEAMGWTNCDMMGVWDHLMSYKGPKAILFGRNLPDEQFNKIRARALAEGIG